MAYRGIFKPTNPKKYKGDPSNIVYRSLWERKFMKLCDNNSNILEWSSEEVIIPYKSPIDNRFHRYFVDFWIRQKNKDGKIVEKLIEIKPKKYTKPPSKQKKITKRYVSEVRTWGINNAKWEAAKKVCTKKGWEFLILTEDHIHG
jgi:hypothetical protein|tara:strand:- start:2757 stop:3191 length:435 start_codon:yes stop_codon:yes gene_type:complete